MNFDPTNIIIFFISKVIYVLATLSLPLFPPILPIILFFYIRNVNGSRVFILRLLPLVIGLVPVLFLYPLDYFMLMLSKYTSFRMNTFFKGAILPIGLYTLFVLGFETWLVFTMRSIIKELPARNTRIKYFSLITYIYCITTVLSYLTIAAQTFGFVGWNIWVMLYSLLKSISVA